MGNEFFDGLSETLTKTAREISERAENFYEVQKLRSRLSAEERLIEQNDDRYGKHCLSEVQQWRGYGRRVGALCENISQHMQVIVGLKEKLASHERTKNLSVLPAQYRSRMRCIVRTAELPAHRRSRRKQTGLWWTLRRQTVRKKRKNQWIQRKQWESRSQGMER